MEICGGGLLRERVEQVFVPERRALRLATRIELEMARSAAHCGEPALVPPTQNQPDAPLIATESYTAKPVAGLAL